MVKEDGGLSWLRYGKSTHENRSQEPILGFWIELENEQLRAMPQFFSLQILGSKSRTDNIDPTLPNFFNPVAGKVNGCSG